MSTYLRYSVKLLNTCTSNEHWILLGQFMGKNKTISDIRFTSIILEPSSGLATNNTMIYEVCYYLLRNYFIGISCFVKHVLIISTYSTYKFINLHISNLSFHNTFSSWFSFFSSSSSSCSQYSASLIRTYPVISDKGLLNSSWHPSFNPSPRISTWGSSTMVSHY